MMCSTIVWSWRENMTKFKSSASKAAFSESISAQHTGTARQAEVRGLDAWVRKWCREQRFRIRV